MIHGEIVLPVVNTWPLASEGSQRDGCTCLAAGQHLETWVGYYAWARRWWGHIYIVIDLENSRQLNMALCAGWIPHRRPFDTSRKNNNPSCCCCIASLLLLLRRSVSRTAIGIISIGLPIHTRGPDWMLHSGESGWKDRFRLDDHRPNKVACEQLSYSSVSALPTGAATSIHFWPYPDIRCNRGRPAIKMCYKRIKRRILLLLSCTGHTVARFRAPEWWRMKWILGGIIR